MIEVRIMRRTLTRTMRIKEKKRLVEAGSFKRRRRRLIETRRVNKRSLIETGKIKRRIKRKRRLI